MIMSKVFNLSSTLFKRIYLPLPTYPIIRVQNLSLNNLTFFSSFSNSHKYEPSDKLTLTSFNPSIVSSRGMKVKGNLRLRCKDCYFVRKDGVMHVMCSSYPRHKQRALSKREKYTWILTFASQSKFRPY